MVKLMEKLLGLTLNTNSLHTLQKFMTMNKVTPRLE